MAAPNHHADEPPASAPASPTAGPGAAPDQDPTGRRGMVRRCVRTLLSLHEDRRNERVLSAMMTRLATMESPAGDVPAAPGDASSAEHAQLAELIEKMELSFKD
ncbi:uncharacterized protein LOC120679471 [Panicum virgatum]|uniref:uncharacterized protein LOC120679471 n=1 Tax=Panicum virgatum TaxID=38727 RepID=UPI0019D5F5A6|nr:uncharacterized protein LOC120679471 [Panicum virgatum]